MAMSSSWSSINPADWPLFPYLFVFLHDNIGVNQKAWPTEKSREVSLGIPGPENEATLWYIPQKSIWVPYFLRRFAQWMSSNSISTYTNHFLPHKFHEKKPWISIFWIYDIYYKYLYISFIEFRPKKQPLKPSPWHDPLRRAASLCGGAGLCLAEHRARRVRLGGCKLCLGRKKGVEGGNPYGKRWKSMEIYENLWWCNVVMYATKIRFWFVSKLVG